MSVSSLQVTNNKMKLFPIILAAGQGTRMNSAIPKVLHPIGGKPMLAHVIDSCKQLQAEKIAVIYGHGGDQVQTKIQDDAITWVHQAEQKGTGHAVAQAAHLMHDDDLVVIAYGDVPLIKADTLQRLADSLQHADLSVLTTLLDDPIGYGRIVRQQGEVDCIVEEKDADATIRQINEVNSGFIAAKGADLKRWLQQLSPENAQGEYYLTDCVGMAVAEEKRVITVICENPSEVEGVNNRLQQAKLEREYQAEQAQHLMLSGVSLLDPSRIDIRGNVIAGKDVIIDVNCVFIGTVKLGNNVTVEANCVIQDSVIDDNSVIKANSVLESASVAENCNVGPFARLRPGADLQKSAKVGNFVEIKKSIIGEGSKVSHLSYIGDTYMGRHVNIGAGTITCNYDGVNKHLTQIGDHVFIGSSSQLVAPIKVGDYATIGAGSTISRDVPANKLTLTRPIQKTINGWQRPTKNKNQ
jgi:bifunctional UDP-N-acetylglucosamine pyrophosphorylase/glucosamine-1-phosphate N-acetyltransferase